MKERLNTVLLLVVIVLLVFLIVRPQDGVGRFQDYGEGGAGAALDTKTGQMCMVGEAFAHQSFPICADLATQ